MTRYYVPCYVTIRCSLPIDALSESEASDEAEEYIEEYLSDELPDTCTIIDTDVRAIANDSFRLIESY